MEEISEYNKDFCNLKVVYLSKLEGNVNLSNLQNFIKSEYLGFYYKKAIFLFVLRCLFLLTQFYTELFVMYPKYYCLDEQIDSKDEAFWSFDGRKYKVKKVEKDRQKY